MPVNELDRLVGELLTFIELREAEQIAYGVYDVSLAGMEVVADFTPSDEELLAGREHSAACGEALRLLRDRADILHLNADASDAASPHNWMFRSRSAELARLLSKLRQRIVRADPLKPRHRIEDGKRLVADVKFHVAARQVPRRDRPIRAALEPLLAATPEHRLARDIVLEAIGVAELGLPKLRELSGFQVDALGEILRVIELSASVNATRGVVVTAGTGSGKTYAFFLPVLVKMLIERCLNGRVGVKAICIYPRLALAENQLADFIEVLYRVNIVLAARDLPALTVGVESGAAVYRLDAFRVTSDADRKKLANTRGWNFSEAGQGYQAPFAYCVGREGYDCAKIQTALLAPMAALDVLICPCCGERYPFILFSRDRMARTPPDLLIATTESLHRRLVSSEHQYLFGTGVFCTPTVVMLDEIHLQTSTAGTQVALLLRRLLARIRLGKREGPNNANLAFVGLSATIAEPKRFASELTGLPVTAIAEVKPQGDTMQMIGAERFYFVRAEDNEDTAVLSTLIQTAMCVAHTMPQPSADSPLERYRSFGFVQSLDLVGRWRYQMQDAERMGQEQQDRRARYRRQKLAVERRPIADVPLYIYRFPPYNRILFPTLFGPDTDCSCGCDQRLGPDPTCAYFQAGECWWVLSRKGRAQDKPLEIMRKSGSDRQTQIGAEQDLIITTSALEVGYDDEALMSVIQYTAPANVASFIQRKGRGGRQVGTRPLVTTVLSPYKSADLFLFRNQHLLTDPTFRKLPLNDQNRYLQRIHGFYALFDWLAYHASREGVRLVLDTIEPRAYEYLLERTGEAATLLDFTDYLRDAFALDRGALESVLLDRDEGLLWATFYHGLMSPLRSIFANGTSTSAATRDLLRARLPENLFSDINLPEVRVNYRPTSDSRPQAESIGLALSGTMPGNVTFRGGEGATWIPPVIGDAEPGLVSLDAYYTCELAPEPVNTANLPQRALRLIDVSPQRLRTLSAYRPSGIMPQQFSRNHDDSLWWGEPGTNNLRQIANPDDAGQQLRPVAPSSSGHPITAVEITPVRFASTPAFTLEPDHPAVACDALGPALSKRIILYSDDPLNGNLLKVHRIILGSQYTIKFADPQAEEIRGVTAFSRDPLSGAKCALGYRITTEGLRLELPRDLVADLPLAPATKSRLRRNAVRHAFITTLTIEHGESYFAADQLTSVLMTLTDEWCADDGETHARLQPRYAAADAEFEARFEGVLRDTHRLSDKNRAAVRALKDQARHRTRFLELYSDAMADGPGFRDHVRDCFQYGVTQALKQVAQEVAGVEALNYVAAWTELRVDYADRADDAIWLYEIGMGGIGVLRATHEVLQHNPDRFWGALAGKMTRCPTAQEEALLRHVLAQPPAWLAATAALAAAVMAATTTRTRQIALDTLLAAVRRLGVIVRQDGAKALLRLFATEYPQRIDGQPLASWQLSREVNRDFLGSCTARLGREPSIAEARSFLYREVAEAARAGAPAPYPELGRLLRLHIREYGGEEGAQQAFENAIERRLLITCRGACPNCLDDRGGDIEAPGLSSALLDRPLLLEWLDRARASQTLVVTADADPALVCAQLRGVFEQNGGGAYLRVPGGALDTLCRTISYLTDAGVDTALGMMYPVVTEVRTIFPSDSTQPPEIEVTVQANRVRVNRWRNVPLASRAAARR